jgi:trans-2,3-dihydro-3-hydroxyanthranilate isomerase
MASQAFRIVNVFTQAQARLSGNPLCVFENGADLTTEVMQALALQFNLSETTFILPATRAGEGANARVRIFTPRYELQFAGHPTLGTAHVCRSLNLGADSLLLEMQAGMIPVSARGDCWTLTAPSATWRDLDVPRDVLAAALGLQVRDIGEKPLWVKAGKEQLVVPLTSLQAVRQVVPVPSKLRHIRSEDDLSMAYVFCLSHEQRALGRFFFPQGEAVLEDPATGSATANLGGWFLGMSKSLPIQLQISQGEFTGRPSTLLLHVDARGKIFVGGDVVEVARGTVTL